MNYTAYFKNEYGFIDAIYIFVWIYRVGIMHYAPELLTGRVKDSLSQVDILSPILYRMSILLYSESKASARS
jgi:hypothetical protein